MHIPDGFLNPQICLSGYAITGGVTWHCLRQIDRDRNLQANIPKASLLTAAFFVASLIHIPIPPTSVHLILNGMMGAVLGYYAFPAILIGLFFQGIMFQHGGLSTLGVNAVILGVPSLAAYHLFRWRARLLSSRRRGETASDSIEVLTKILSFSAGAGALLLSAGMFTILLVTTISPDLDASTERNAIYASLIGYSIQAGIEGVFSLMLISFLEKVKPELLQS